MTSPAAPLITVEEAFRLRLNGLNGGGCPVCHAQGDAHRPWCTRPDLRKCRGCAAPIPLAGLGVRYCQACRQAPRCKACYKVGGAHRPNCLWLRRKRQNVPTFQGVVSAAMLVELYERERKHLIRIAARICGNECEDVVQGVFAYLVGRLDTLSHLDKKLAVIAVMNAAKGEMMRARHKHLTAMADVAEDLLERYAAQSAPGCPVCGSLPGGPRYCGECVGT